MKQKIIDDFKDNDKIESQSDFWDYENQKEIIGVILRIELDSFGEHFVLKTNDKDELHLQNLTALNGKLKLAKINDKVKIVYLGEVKSQKSGRIYKDFDVYIKKRE